MDNPDHSAAFKIFHYWFDVNIPGAYLVDAEMVRRWGVFSSGDKAVDQQQATSMARARLTVADMAEKYDEGATISLVNPRDSLRIYNYLNEHLKDWKNRHAIDYNLRKVPLEDLRKLEALAQAMYRVARMFMTEGTEQSNLFSKINQLSGGGRRMRRRTQEATKVEVAPEHNPIMDSLTKEHHQRTKIWK